MDINMSNVQYVLNLFNNGNCMNKGSIPRDAKYYYES